MYVTIPMSSNSSFRQEITLDSRPYIISFHWNTRGAFWVMDIYDRDETLLLGGIKLVIGFPLKLRSNNPLLPAGDFWCIDTQLSTMMNEPGRNDFVQDRKLELIYTGVEE